jgi:hypothetical protein
MPSDEDMNSDMDSLRQINNMMYLRPSQASLTCKRQVKIQPFQTVTASPGGTLQVIVNSGDEFLYGPTSVLKLQYGLAVGANRFVANLWGPNGSILNIFKSIRLTHRSGQLLEYIDEVSDYAAIKRLNEYNNTSRAALDALLNYNPNYNVLAANNPTVLVAMIPLGLLCGLFSSVELLPPQVVAGLRIEIQLKQNSEAFTLNADTIADQSIMPSLLMDCVTPYDSVVREIVQQTADTSSSGIQYTYETAFYTSQDSNTATTFSLDIQNSVAIASRAFFVMKKSAITANNTAKMSFFPNLNQLQWRAGAEYFPNQQISSIRAVAASAGSEALNQSEQYKDTMIAFMSYPHQFGSPQILGSSVALADYSKVVGAEPDGASTVYAQTLDRSPAGIAGKYSGLQTNNSRLLNVSGTKILNGLSDPNVIKCWMVSTRVVNCAGDTAIVDR